MALVGSFKEEMTGYQNSSSRTGGDSQEERIPILVAATLSDHGNHAVDSNGVSAMDEEEDDNKAWGWVVVAVSFLCNLILDGIGYSFGVLLEPLRQEFQEPRGSISFVGSILAGVTMLTGPIAALGVNRYGARLTCIVGSIISASAIFLSTYATSLPTLIISYGLFGGLGLGLMYLPAVVAVGQYFSSRLSLATGICVSGSGAGALVLPPIAAQLTNMYGWRGCVRVMAALCLLCAIFGLAMVPRKGANQKQEAAKKTFNCRILTTPTFLLVFIAKFLMIIAVYATYVYLPQMGLHVGLSPAHASLLISAIGVTNTIGRILSGWLADLPCVSPLVASIVASAAGGLMPLLMIFTDSYAWLLVLSALFGLVISASPTVTSALVVMLLGKDDLSSGFGILTFSGGLAALLGPPISGYVLDATGSYEASFTFAAGCLMGSSLVYSCVLPILCCQWRAQSADRVLYTQL